MYQQSKDTRAQDLAERAYRLAPLNAAVMDTLGWLLVEKEDTARALPLLKKASELLPASTEIRYHYAVALTKTGDHRDAKQQFEQLLAVKDFDRRDEVRTLLLQL